MRPLQLLFGILVVATLLVSAENPGETMYKGVQKVPVIGSMLDETTYFLDEEELASQVESLHAFITNQMEITTPNLTTKANMTALGFPDLSVFRQIFHGFGDTVKRDAVCSGCQVFLGLMSHQIKVHRTSETNLIGFATFTCTFFRLANPEVCTGILERLGPSFYYIVQNRSKIKPTIMCGVLFQSLGCRIPGKAITGSDFDWNVDTLRKPGYKNPYGVPRPEIDVHPSNDYRNPQKTTKRVMKIAHFADIHVDPDYKEGSNAECDNEVLCCQERFGYPDPDANVTGAGRFGDNRKCDAPMDILHMALGHLKRTHGDDIDVIYMTGDLVPHNIWYTSEEENSAIIRNASAVFSQYFPTATIIPCLGNHEPHPVNLFSPSSRTFGSPQKNPIPPNLRQDWTYEVAYSSWRQWIPPDQADNFLTSGHYAVEITPEFRVLVVNTNVCYGFNMWQLYDPQDPGGQLEWLQKQLELSQATNKTVHIVGHVPPGHEDCFKTWSREFYKIVAKHSSIIGAQFYGHTHYDEFRILHDPIVKTDPISVMWVGPSVTPYRIHNPGYRIYHVDITKGYQVVDHETWIYDLHGVNKEKDMFANREAVPWFRLYQATKEYKIPDLTPKNLQTFVKRMANDKATFEIFYKYYFKAVDPDHAERDQCDTLCRKRILCGIVQAYYDDDEGSVECSSIQKEVDGVVVPLRVLEHRKRFIWL